MKKYLYALFVSMFCLPAIAAEDPSVRLLIDRAEVIDALYRFGAGQDLDDTALFESAFVEQSSVDFTGPAARLGAKMQVMKGRDHIVKLIMGTVSHLDTTHTVTNPRVSISGDRASLFALVEAQHIPKGKRGTHLLLKNIYTVSLVRSGSQWKIENMRIDNVWFTGDPKVLFTK